MRRFTALFIAMFMLLSVSAGAAEMMVEETISPQPPASHDNGFSDVSADADYAAAVAWCQSRGLINGVGGGRFDPDGTLTRSMMATVLYWAAGSPAVSGALTFSDAQPGQWYTDAVVWAETSGYMRGYGNRLFGISDPVSVEQLEVIHGKIHEQGDPLAG